MAMVLVKVEGVGLDPNQGPVVVLKDNASERILPIWIGPNEANAIQMKLDGQEYGRPLTHDLIANMLLDVGAELQHVEITEIKDGTYYATLVLATQSGEVRVDARPSDSIAIALRTESDIFADDSLFRLPGSVDGGGSSPEAAEDEPRETEEEKNARRVRELKNRLRGIDPIEFGFYRLGG